ncbi:3007_t:CDS:2, partial [Diversispora eburnea]
EKSTRTKNFLDGYFIYYIKGLERCEKHTEDMKSNNISDRYSRLQVRPEEYEIDLGEKFEKTKNETTRIIKRAFTPGFQLGNSGHDNYDIKEKED